ncbi:MAG: hypothetical protein ABIF28_17725 [Pseudomonadota bacterium]
MPDKTAPGRSIRSGCPPATARKAAAQGIDIVQHRFSVRLMRVTLGSGQEEFLATSRLDPTTAAGASTVPTRPRVRRHLRRAAEAGHGERLRNGIATINAAAVTIDAADKMQALPLRRSSLGMRDDQNCSRGESPAEQGSAWSRTWYEKETPAGRNENGPSSEDRPV